MTPAVDVAAVRIRYGEVVAVQDISLAVAPGEVHVLLGPSGSGKTTLLRAIAGFEPVDAGTLTLHGALVDDGRRHVPPERRQVGVVFQDYALFPHLDVAGNVGFGMARRDPAAVAALLEEVGLGGYGSRPVSALSGGEQQRVALARALAQRPSVVLMDEPFSNLNPELRHDLRDRTLTVLRAQGITTVLVTHDRYEAFAAADRISVIRAGRLLQTGAPRELYETPGSVAVARSVGDVALVPATVRDGVADTPLGPVALRGSGPERGTLILRPEQLRLSLDGPGVAGEVVRVAYHGATDLVVVTVAGHTLQTSTPPGLLQPGQAVRVAVTGPGVCVSS